MPLFNPSLAPNLLGDGSDGALVYDGVATILGVVPAGNTYTLTRDIYATDLTVNVGVTLIPNGFRIFVEDTLLNNGVISGNGKNATGITAGASTVATGSLQTAAGGGGNGRSTTGAGNGGAGSGGNNICGSGGGNGGNADGGNLGGLGNTSASPNANTGGFRHILPFVFGRLPGVTSTVLVAMNGSGGGGGGGTNVGTGTASSGAGGSASIPVIIFCNVLNNQGTISSNGGNGSNATATGDGKAGGGGGGAGGFVGIWYKTLIAQGTVTANGGLLGTGIGGGANGVNGSAGTTLVEALTA